MQKKLTASKLYDYIQCPHKVWRDIYGPQEEKIQESNPFVELLWKKGIQHEERVVAKLGECLDLSGGTIDERAERTMVALKNKTSLIYQGVLKYENMLGIPDLMKLMPDGSYMPIDIKSGSAFEDTEEESSDEGKPKLHYIVQLCLYNDLLKKLGYANHNNGKVIDIHYEEVEYNLMDQKGPRDKTTWWENYERIKNEVGMLLSNTVKNKPASSGKCKLCPWYESCNKWCKETNDLTNLFYLGRSYRDRINEDLIIENVDELLNLDVEEIMEQKEREKKSGNNSFLYRIGKDSLIKLINRANILEVTKKPVVYGVIDFPKVNYELFFDIEDDPTQEFVYMHGIYERNLETERYIHFTATELSSEAEKIAWAEFWKYIDSLPKDDFAVYYYSHHEKTTYKRMQKLYPDVVTAERVEEFFANPNVIDLYSIVRDKTDWPVGSYSLKTIATYLKFDWRDQTPSGALSIQWFNDYLEKKDDNILKRILEYNEDDCKATMVIKDEIENLSNKQNLI